MRVVAGTAGGLRLESPAGRDVRPTTDRVRESVFGALDSLGAIDGAVVLDLFAGSGALGIEALSRGAAHATFVDRSAAALAVVRRNLAHTGFEASAEVVRGEATTHLGALRRAPDLVLLDPPYAGADWPSLLGAVDSAVGPRTLVVAESDRPVDLPAVWEPVREKRYGGTWVVFGRTPTGPPG